LQIHPSDLDRISSHCLLGHAKAPDNGAVNFAGET
jgi:hypothetical protein